MELLRYYFVYKISNPPPCFFKINYHHLNPTYDEEHKSNFINISTNSTQLKKTQK